MKLWGVVKDKMLQYPKQTVREKDTKISFSALSVMAEQFATQLNNYRCCAILCQSEMMAAMALLSCFAAGVTAVPLSARYGELHCKKILDMISPDAVITDRDGSLSICRSTDPRYVEPAIHPALIMCTSGTTGSPKGVMLTEDNIISNVSDISSYFNIDSEDTILISRPLYHCAVLTGEFLTSLTKGTRIIFYSERFNPPIMPTLICQNEITVFCGTPTLFNMMIRFIRSETNIPLRHICVSGECMDKEIGNRLAHTLPDAEIYHVYGLTEACPRISYLPPNLFREYPDCVGIPLHSVEIKILRADGSVAKEDEEGVLYVKGSNVMTGYYNDPEQTNAVLTDGWLCTHDIAVINSAGLLKIKGRSDDLIIKGGMNIYPQEIESALKIDSRVREVLAYGYTTSSGTQIGMKISGDFSSINDVQRLCAEKLPGYQIPTRIEILPELEKNGSGKIKRINTMVEFEKRLY